MGKEPRCKMQPFLELIGLVLVAAVSCGALSTDEFTGAVSYLKKYGYLNVPLDSGGQPPPPQAIAEAVRIFQNVTNLQVSGLLDPATLSMMSRPRCGLQDSFNDRSMKYRVLGHWRKKMLTYRIYNHTPHLGLGKTRAAIFNAFKYWSEVSPLKFREVQQGRADIKLSFHRKDKSCSVPFDGRGHVLAHADPPESGVVHFDEDELWTDGRSYGSNLMIVAVHEIGHALGLGHSQYPGAVMGPLYHGYRSDFRLHADDIRGIQALYGRPAAIPSPKHPSVPVPGGGGGATDLCKASLDAAMLGPSDKTYVFSGHHVWTVSSSGLSSPVLISALWKELPRSLNAAVHSQRTGKSYFIKGDTVWRYTGFKLDLGFPRRLVNIPANIDSALYLKKMKKLVFFKGSGYWLWDELGQTDFKSYPKHVSRLIPGAPSSTDAALTWTDGHIYLFKSSQFWRVNQNQQVEKGFPQSTAAEWLQCDD